tara:strand:- start:394 stop:594 length:201 start_codon:yes stop_codon:yes gene_type:complete
MVTLTDKEEQLVQETHDYMERNPDAKRTEVTLWIARQMVNYMMAGSPMSRKELGVLTAIINAVYPE